LGGQLYSHSTLLDYRDRLGVALSVPWNRTRHLTLWQLIMYQS